MHNETLLRVVFKLAHAKKPPNWKTLPQASALQSKRAKKNRGELQTGKELYNLRGKPPRRPLIRERQNRAGEEDPGEETGFKCAPLKGMSSTFWKKKTTRRGKMGTQRTLPDGLSRALKKREGPQEKRKERSGKLRPGLASVFRAPSERRRPKEKAEKGKKGPKAQFGFSN